MGACAGEQHEGNELGSASPQRLDEPPPCEQAEAGEGVHHQAGQRGEPVDGEHPGEILIPSKDHGTVEVDVPFEYATVGMVVGQLLREGELEYRFTGVLTARTPVGRMRVTFDERGVFRP